MVAHARARWTVLTLALLAGGCSHEETKVQSPASEQAGPLVIQGAELRSGTSLLAALDQHIGKDSKPGQTFTAHVVQPVVDESGRPIIPEGSMVIGQVGDVKSGGRDHPAEVDLVIQKVVTNGVEHPLDARIADTDVTGSKRSVKPAPVGIGAAGGGLLGGIIGGWQGAVIGGLSGAVAGTAVSLGLSGYDANLPVGTVLTVQLTRPISVAALRSRAG